MKLPSHYKHNILELLTRMQENPIPDESYDVAKIKGFTDTFRIRIGDVRVVYQVFWKEQKVRVAIIEFRGRAYK